MTGLMRKVHVTEDGRAGCIEGKAVSFPLVEVAPCKALITTKQCLFGQCYINLAQAGVTGEEGSSTEKVPSYDWAVFVVQWFSTLLIL